MKAKKMQTILMAVVIGSLYVTQLLFAADSSTANVSNSVTIIRKEPTSALTGDKAKKYLKEKDVYASLEKSLEKIRHGFADNGKVFSADNPKQNKAEENGTVYPSLITQTFVEIKKAIASDGAGDEFGTAVSISGDTAIVGAYSDDVGANTNQGAAYIFERNAGGTNNWGLVKQLTASDGAAFDNFGRAVSIAGDVIIVGANKDQIGTNVDQGSAYIFERNTGGANNWGEVKKLTASDGSPSDEFGRSVSISGDVAIAGVPVDNIGGNAGQGSAFVFERNTGGANNWGQVKKLTASDGASGDIFGWSVSIAGNTAIVGAVFDDFNTGSAYIFERNTGGTDNWGQVKKLLASDAFFFDYFAWMVSVSGDTVIIAAPRAQIGSNFTQGAAYIFERNTGGANNWGQVKKLVSSDGVANDFFGSSAYISGDTAIVGVPSNTVGGNTSQGSAYIFERNMGGTNNWGQSQKLTASDGAANDQFATSVAVSGSTVIVGSSLDDIGANTNQGSSYFFSNFSTTAAGANIYGRVQTATGHGIVNAIVIISGGRLTEPIYTRTSSFGYFSFEDIPVGETYFITVISKRYRFVNSTEIINLNGEITDLNFIAEAQ